MLIKARYIKNGEPAGREYTFISEEDCKVDDIVCVGSAKAAVTKVNVPEEDILPFRDKLKKVDKKVEEET